MNEARAFLAGRTPPPPDALRRWLDGVPLADGAPAQSLAQAGLDALDRARSRPGRVRESAFHLLAADALLTYACEAALEMDGAPEVLADLMERAAEAR